VDAAEAADDGGVIAVVAVVVGQVLAAESGPLVIWAVKVLEREIRAGNLPGPPG
jgi:hypothetical protein